VTGLDTGKNRVESSDQMFSGPDEPTAQRVVILVTLESFTCNGSLFANFAE